MNSHPTDFDLLLFASEFWLLSSAKQCSLSKTCVYYGKWEKKMIAYSHNCKYIISYTTPGQVLRMLDPAQIQKKPDRARYVRSVENLTRQCPVHK